MGQSVLDGCWFCDTSLVLLSVAMESFQPFVLGISGDSSHLTSEHEILQFSPFSSFVHGFTLNRCLCPSPRSHSIPVPLWHLLPSSLSAVCTSGEGGLQKAPSQHELSEPYFPFRHYSTPQRAKCILHFKAARCGSGLIQECSANLHAAIFHRFILHFQTLLTKINAALWLHRHNSAEIVWNRISLCRPPLAPLRHSYEHH